MQTQIKSQNSTSTSKRFVIVLLEEFAIYSFGSLLDALRIANALSGKALYNWIVLAENGAVIRSSACTEFKGDFGLIELQRAQGRAREKKAFKRAWEALEKRPFKGILQAF